jgi:hypothetical protein
VVAAGAVAAVVAAAAGGVVGAAAGGVVGAAAGGVVGAAAGGVVGAAAGACVAAGVQATSSMAKITTILATLNERFIWFLLSMTQIVETIRYSSFLFIFVTDYLLSNRLIRLFHVQRLSMGAGYVEQGGLDH